MGNDTGFHHEIANPVDVSDIPAGTLADIQAEVEKDGIDLNVDPGTGTATPDIVTVVTDTTETPTEKPL